MNLNRIRIISYLWLNLVFFTLPFQFAILPSFGKAISNILLPLNQIILKHQQNTFYLNSDSIYSFSTVFVVFFCSLVLSIFIFAQKSWSNKKIINWLKKGLLFWLVLYLCKYGFDKLFLNQFYPPESNTLYTPLGFLDKDIAFWSIMGTSKGYQLFMGFMEIIPAILLIFRKTRFIGLILAVGVLTNVFVINLSFDISVKLLSGFLVLTTFVLLSTYKVQLVNLTGIQFTVSSHEIQPHSKYSWVKWIFIVLIFIESMFPYYNFETMKLNTPKSILHEGAYVITDWEGETELFDPYSIKRMHIHNSGYIILETDQQQFLSIPIKVRHTDSLIRWNRHLIHLRKWKGNYIFTWKEDAHQNTLTTQKIDLDQLPLRKDQFHWTLESYMNP